MMSASRREFLSRSTAAMAAGSWLAALPRGFAGDETRAKIRVGACVVNLDQAKEAGLDGVEVGVGSPAERLEIARPEVRARYREQMSRTGLPICSLMMGLLNDCPLASDPRAPAWLDQSIEAAADLGARIILVAFFGNGDLLDSGGRPREAEIEEVIQRLKAAAPRAAEVGVVLAIENYLDAAQNARILDRIDHPAVQIYYDCYNTGATRGYDVPAELRILKDRIVQIHFKNGPDYLESGQVDHAPIADALRDINFEGWIVLETSSPSGDPVADVRRNAAYTRQLLS